MSKKRTLINKNITSLVMHTCEYKIGKSHALERLVFVSQHYLKQRTTTNTNKNI